MLSSLKKVRKTFGALSCLLLAVLGIFSRAALGTYNRRKSMNNKKTSPAVGGKPAKPMTAKDAARIHSAEARAGGGAVSKRSFTARATRAAAENGGS